MANSDVLTGRAWMVTMWSKNIVNMGYGDLLNEDGKPKDGTGKEILDAIREDWLCSGKGRTSGGVSCLSANDGFHLHLGVYCSCKVKFSTVINVLGNAHVDPQRGTKEQLVLYLRKEGKFAEKGELVLYESGLDSLENGQGHRTDLDEIKVMIEQGLNWRQIVRTDLKYRKYESMIKAACFDKRYQETPLKRSVNVFWHIGDPGSGKTYTYLNLCNTHGSDNVYLLTDYKNGFDFYCGEAILCLDEFRGQFPFFKFMNLLDGYKIQIDCRYQNLFALWSEVHIFTVYPPEKIYEDMVEKNRDIDSYGQLQRRISTIVYHYKKDNDFRSYSLPMSEYKSYEDLKNRALDAYTFHDATEAEQLVFADI